MELSHWVHEMCRVEKVKTRERNVQGRRVAEEEARERDTLEIASRDI